MSIIEYNGVNNPRLCQSKISKVADRIEEEMVFKVIQDLQERGLGLYSKDELIDEIDYMISTQSYRDGTAEDSEFSIVLQQSFPGMSLLKSRIAKLELILQDKDCRELEHKVRALHKSDSAILRIFKTITGVDNSEIVAVTNQLFKNDKNTNKDLKNYVYTVEDLKYNRQTGMIMLPENVIDRSFPVTHKLYFKPSKESLVWFKKKYTVWRIDVELKDDFVHEIHLRINLNPDLFQMRRSIPVRLDLSKMSKVISTFTGVFFLAVPNVYNVYLKEIAFEYWLTKEEKSFVLESCTYQTNFGVTYNISKEIILLSRYKYKLMKREKSLPIISLKEIYDFYVKLRYSKDFYHGDLKPQNIGYVKGRGIMLIDYYKKNGSEIRYRNDLFYQDKDKDGCVTAEHYAFMISVAASCGKYFPRNFSGYILLSKKDNKYYLDPHGSYRLYVSPVAPFEYIMSEMLDEDLNRPIHGVLSGMALTKHECMCDQDHRLCILLNGECVDYETTKKPIRLGKRQTYDIDAITERDYLSA